MTPKWNNTSVPQQCFSEVVHTYVREVLWNGPGKPLECNRHIIQHIKPMIQHL